MQVYQLLRLALNNIGEDTDELTVAEYRDELLQYFNQAYSTIMRTAAVYDRAEVQLCGGEADLTGLERPCCGVRSVSVCGVGRCFNFDGRTLRTQQKLDGLAEVEYKYLPPELALDSDEPVFPADLHYCLADYAAWRMLGTGSRGRQQRGEFYLANWLQALNRLRDRTTGVIVNKYA